MFFSSPDYRIYQAVKMPLRSRSSPGDVAREEDSKASVPVESPTPRKTRLTTKVPAEYLPQVVVKNCMKMVQSRVPFSKVDPLPVKSDPSRTSIATSSISWIGESDPKPTSAEASSISSPVKPTPIPTSTVASSVCRRNASRACRKADINYSDPPDVNYISPQPTQTRTSPVPSRTPSTRTSRRPSSTRAKRPSCTTLYSSNRKRRARCPEPEPCHCRFCDKPFKLLESAQVSLI